MSTPENKPADNLKFRAMAINDLNRVLEIEHELFSAPWSREMFEQELQNNFSFIAELDEPVGFCCGYKVLDEFSITNIGICKKYQMKGLGTKLVNLIVDKFIEMGCMDFFLEVRKSNLPAIKLYEKCGFKQIGVRLNYYSSPKENAIVMAKSIMK